ncbi:DUF397 domain-containing protein [Nocardia goodfellowii]
MNPELAQANWFKSSHSGGQTDCVEVAFLPGVAVGVRDSKNPSGSALILTGSQWDAFIAHIRHDGIVNPA